LHYAEGSAMSPLLLKLVFDRVAANPAPWPVSAIARRIATTVTNAFIAPNLKRHLDYIEAELGLHSWFAGEQFTAADVQMSFPLEIAVSRAGLDAGRPKSMAFLDRIHSRDAYKRALQRGGKYDY
jgi:glutathione S-transferase